MKLHVYDSEEDAEGPVKKGNERQQVKQMSIEEFRRVKTNRTMNRMSRV